MKKIITMLLSFLVFGFIANFANAQQTPVLPKGARIVTRAEMPFPAARPESTPVPRNAKLAIRVEGNAWNDGISGIVRNPFKIPANSFIFAQREVAGQVEYLSGLYFEYEVPEMGLYYELDRQRKAIWTGPTGVGSYQVALFTPTSGLEWYYIEFNFGKASSLSQDRKA